MQNISKHCISIYQQFWKYYIVFFLRESFFCKNHKIENYDTQYMAICAEKLKKQIRTNNQIKLKNNKVFTSELCNS